MDKKRISITVIISFLIFTSGFLIFIRSREKVKEEALENIPLNIFVNDKLGYEFGYPLEWHERELDDGNYIHSAFNNENISEVDVDWRSYEQTFRSAFVGFADFVYIDGAMEYQIEHHVYRNHNELSLSQWYELFVLVEAFNAEKITEAQLIRKISKITEGGSIANYDKIFDPWTPRGNVLKIGNKDVLKVTLAGNHRYEGFQYYILSHNNYFFVFSFGYGDRATNRNQWHKNDRGVKNMIKTLKDK